MSYFSRYGTWCVPSNWVRVFTASPPSLSISLSVCLWPGKVILHPDLSGVPLLILANKQDCFVRALYLLVHKMVTNCPLVQTQIRFTHSYVWPDSIAITTGCASALAMYIHLCTPWASQALLSLKSLSLHRWIPVGVYSVEHYQIPNSVLIIIILLYTLCLGCVATDRSRGSIWHECSLHWWQRLQNTESLSSERVRQTPLERERERETSTHTLYTNREGVSEGVEWLSRRVQDNARRLDRNNHNTWHMHTLFTDNVFLILGNCPSPHNDYTATALLSIDWY